MVIINQMAHFNPMGRASTSPEREACVIHRCSPSRRELGLAKCGPKASYQGLLRLPHLVPISGLRLKPTNFAFLGVRWRDLSSVPLGSLRTTAVEVPSLLAVCRDGEWFKVKAGRSCLKVPLPTPIFHLMTIDMSHT